MENKKTLICIDHNNAYAIALNVTPNEWESYLKKEYYEANKLPDGGIFNENPIILELQEIDDIIDSEADYVNYVNNFIRNSDNYVWLEEDVVHALYK